MVPNHLRLATPDAGCNAQANSSIPIVRQNLDMPAKLGAIFYNSIAQNQSYAVAGMLT